MDHFGTNLQVFSTGVSKENEIEDNCSIMSNMSMEMEDGVDLTEFMSPRKSNMEGVPYDGVSQGDGNGDAIEAEIPEDDNVPNVKGKSRFNEEIPWKKLLPILVLMFTNPKQLKFLLCNYVVANGYQLYYEKINSKRLLVKCCDGKCKFSL
ncbi:unnamed protein product [Lactuca saligna]|uniref:Uncharacterized protein n=1 Tax=Lactuca saligna TaxID=75948 RepID=A0AA36DZX1_LACSI|nr:unnamed protein product [Lactuca saligna]